MNYNYKKSGRMLFFLQVNIGRSKRKKIQSLSKREAFLFHLNASGFFQHVRCEVPHTVLSPRSYWLFVNAALLIRLSG